MNKEDKAMNPEILRGIIPAIVTPFDKAQELDLAALRTLTKFLIDQGVHAIMTTGGTGEFPSLSREEKRLVTGTVVEISAGQVPVIAGTAACSTRETIQLTRDAGEAGATAAIITTPYYFPLPEIALLDQQLRAGGVSLAPAQLEDVRVALSHRADVMLVGITDGHKQTRF